MGRMMHFRARLVAVRSHVNRSGGCGLLAAALLAQAGLANASTMILITVSQPMSDDSSEHEIHDVTFPVSGSSLGLGSHLRYTFAPNLLPSSVVTSQPYDANDLTNSGIEAEIVLPPGALDESGMPRPMNVDTLESLTVRLDLTKALSRAHDDSLAQVAKWRASIQRARERGEDAKARRIEQYPPAGERLEHGSVRLRELIRAAVQCLIRNASRETPAIRSLRIDIVAAGYRDLGGIFAVPGCLTSRPTPEP